MKKTRENIPISSLKCLRYFDKEVETFYEEKSVIRPTALFPQNSPETLISMATARR
jgi:hypothetical protein